ncbi:MAG TPA: hypothetical protein VHB25_03455 [Gemmatimonadaceae bacterium]|nr:hypothetical protein [Gemmatimonadaceae bacterium]
MLRKLGTPRKVQDFLNAIPINYERGGETCLSPLMVLRRNRAQCIEGAMLAALALAMHGEPPLLLDLRTTADDIDHVVAPFRAHGRWGAISKTTHAVLRYREPVYRDVRELVMSYFHEYFLDNGKKTLRQYSDPFDLRRWPGEWATSTEPLWDLQHALDRSPHHDLLTRAQIARLRRADAIERRAGKLKER